MKQGVLLIFLVISLSQFVSDGVAFAETPVDLHGALHVEGTHLLDVNASSVQLRGISTHGLQWYGWGDCLNSDSLDWIANDWKADVIRLSMYADEGGYNTNPEYYQAMLDTLITEVTARGMYIVLDWHMLDPGDPYENLEEAKAFFEYFSHKYADADNILYEIANEPSGVSWASIKSYAEEIIPIIRENDENSVILVGTRAWSSRGVGRRISKRNMECSCCRQKYSLHISFLWSLTWHYILRCP